MKLEATFIDAQTGRVVPPTRLGRTQRRLKEFQKPGERGSRRYPFRVPTFGVGLVRARYVGESICVLDERTNEVHRIDPDGQHSFLYAQQWR